MPWCVRIRLLATSRQSIATKRFPAVEIVAQPGDTLEGTGSRSWPSLRALADVLIV